MLHPHPDNRFVNPDDDTSDKTTEKTGADHLHRLCHSRGFGRGCGGRPYGVAGRLCAHNNVSFIALATSFKGRFRYSPMMFVAFAAVTHGAAEVLVCPVAPCRDGACR